jgi:hypothetical protein
MVPNRLCCEAKSARDGASANQGDIEPVVIIWLLRYCDFAVAVLSFSYYDACVVCDVVTVAVEARLLQMVLYDVTLCF